MKVVWISNAPPFKFKSIKGEIYGGGWLQEQYRFLFESNVEIISFFNGFSNSQYCDDDNKRYFTFTSISNNYFSKKRGINYFKKMLLEISPKLVHIHGTELPHCYCMCKAALELDIPYIVTLQGVVSEISKHVFTGFSPYNVLDRSFRDFFLSSSTIDLYTLYQQLGCLEKFVVKNSACVIGRTEWDKAWVSFNFDNLNYLSLGEPVRYDFKISQKWSYNKCKKFNLFVSQSSTSIKGLHILLEAIILLKPRFPEISLTIAGKDYFSNSFRNFALRTSFENFIVKFIKTNSLEDNIKFIGFQNEVGMINSLLDCHVFVQPSLIENSPNSLMEAVYLNVPSVASFVGGIPSLYQNASNVKLYQSDSSLMLAHEISNFFSCDVFSTNHKLNVDNLSDIGLKLLGVYEKFK